MNHVMPHEVDNSRIRVVVFPTIIKFVPSKIMRAPSQSPRTRLLITLYMRHSNLSTIVIDFMSQVVASTRNHSNRDSR